MMDKFTSKTILGSQTLGDRLKRSRNQKNLSLETIGKELRIRPEFLYYLENGQYNKLPGTLYIKNYLKKYCNFLDLQWSMIEKIYDREIIIYQQKLPKKLQSKFHQKALILPRIIFISVIIVLVAGLGIYVTVEIANIGRPPQLTIYDIPDQITITEHSVTLEGKTDPEAQVTINGQQITIDKQGNFSEIISLRSGLNSLKIAAKTKHSKERIIYKQILVNN